VCKGGADFEEAIEVALRHANQDETKTPSRLILIGDAPPHFEKKGHAVKGCVNYILETDYVTECDLLAAANIPVFAFQLNSIGKTTEAFKRISGITGGEFSLFDEKKLLDTICLQALEQVGGEELKNKYRKKYAVHV
jgi:hypothetical protein